MIPGVLKIRQKASRRLCPRKDPQKEIEALMSREEGMVGGCPQT
jgi:hypothetical protein